MNPAFLIDFYKVGHIDQYPKDVTQVWSNFTPRSTRVIDQKHVVFFGLQYFIKEILQKEWQNNFFNVYRPDIIKEYREVISATLGIKEPRTDHIEALHSLGYLPLAIYALPEGTSVPLGVPMLVITNTHPDFAWLPNYFETILSNILWKPSTSATTSQAFRRLFLKHAKAAGETDFSFVDWQGHDFSERGMSGREDAILSGMGHLLSFSGTDTLPAIIQAHETYGADYTIGGSVPATEHSVMCAGGKDDELETFRSLIEDIYPSGIVSIVSDTWDLWKVLTEYVPALKDKILARDGKVVIRPDSGDPTNILCGDRNLSLYKQPEERSPAAKGTLRLLAEAVGMTEQKNGLPLINKMAAIYGDSISLARADSILDRTVRELKLSPYNVVFGIGSYTYEYVTRDTYGFAMKATAIRRGVGGPVEAIWKKPVTDEGGKTSHRGIPAVYGEGRHDNDLVVGETLDPRELDACAFRTVYYEGELRIEDTFEQIRKRVRE